MRCPTRWSAGLLRVGLVATLALWTCRVAGAGVGAWTTEGPHGGAAKLVVLAPGKPQTVLVVAESSSALWRSNDGGTTWRRPVYVPSDYSREIEWLVIDPFDTSTYYAVLAFGQLEKSTDAGVSWTPLRSGVGTVAASPTEPSVLYAAIFEGVLRSEDGGETFALAGTLSGVRRLEPDPGDASTLYAATSHGFFSSHDRGEQWTAARNGLADADIWSLAVDPVHPGTFYAGTFEGIWKTTDGGESWRRLLTTELIVDLAVDPLAPDEVYAIDVVFHQLFKSVDAGVTWEAIYYPYRPSSLALDPSASGTVYVTASGDPEGLFDGGLLKSTDGGRSFATVGVPDTRISALAVDPQRPSILYAGLLEGLYRSKDGGATWTPMAVGPSISALAIDPSRPWRSYAAAFDFASDAFTGVFRSNDRGETWIVPPYPAAQYLPRLTSLVVEPFFTDRLYATSAYDKEALFSADGGVTWNVVRGLAGRRLVALGADASQPGTLYAWGDGVQKSTDGGVTWNSTERGLPDAQVTALAVAPRDSSRVYAATPAGIYRSVDAAGSWSLMNSGFGDAGVLAVAARAPDLLYAGTNRGVLASADGGATWTGFNPGLKIREVSALVIDPIDPELLHAGTRGGGVNEIFVDGPCRPDATTLCFDDEPDDGRFRARMRFETAAGDGAKGEAWGTPLAPLGLLDGAVMAFFGGRNPEALVKVLDGCASNDRFWVFAAAATSVGFDLSVVDTRSAARRIYRNADGRPAATITDTDAFAACGTAPRPVDARAEGEPARTGPRSQAEPGDPCVADATTLCLDDRPGDRRFRVRMSFATTLGGGASGDARATPLAPLGFSQGAILAFFSPRNPEVLVKVLDGCRTNGHFWVFAAAATTVGFELVVDDTVAGARRTYYNPDRRAAETLTDVQAFATCRDD